MSPKLTRFVMITLMVQFLFCANPLGPKFNYEPPVVFYGYINGDEVTLSGNYYWQNSCELKKDTVRMYFYSKNFSESNRIRYGDLMRIDFYPNHDSMVGVKDVLFHLARYYEGNSSYTISPRDTVAREKIVQMRRISLVASRGRQVNIDKIYLRTGTVNGTPGQQLEIKDGVITGVVE